MQGRVCSISVTPTGSNQSPERSGERSPLHRIRTFQWSVKANRNCADCSDCGPTHICLDFQIFVCQACSTVHEKMGHSVKAASNSEWTCEEVEALEAGGNKVASKAWMARWTTRDQLKPDGCRSQPGDVQDFIHTKYIERRWWRDASQQELNSSLGPARRRHQQWASSSSSEGSQDGRPGTTSDEEILPGGKRYTDACTIRSRSPAATHGSEHAGDSTSSMNDASSGLQHTWKTPAEAPATDMGTTSSCRRMSGPVEEVPCPPLASSVEMGPSRALRVEVPKLAKQQRGGRDGRRRLRKQRVETLLTACAKDIARLEHTAARELAASYRLAILLDGRSTSPSDKVEPPQVLDEEAAESTAESEEACITSEMASMQDKSVENAVEASQKDLQLLNNLDEQEMADKKDTKAAASEAGASAVVCDGSSNSSAQLTMLLEALAHDNTVMECNLQDYQAAICAAVQEATYLQTEIAQLEGTCGKVIQLQDLLEQEIHASSSISEENNLLKQKIFELVNVIKEAVEATEDDEGLAIIEDLMQENDALRTYLFCPGSMVPSSADDELCMTEGGSPSRRRRWPLACATS